MSVTPEQQKTVEIADQASGSTNHFNLAGFVAQVLVEIEHVSTFLAEQFLEIKHVPAQTAEDVETFADQYVAKYWRDFFIRTFPFVNVDSEESVGKVTVGSDYTVRIDSIDGSKHFRAGIPIFSSNLSLRFKDETLFAVIANPTLGEIYHAVAGQGAKLNGEVIRVSRVNTLSKAFIVCEAPTSKLGRTNPIPFVDLQDLYHIIAQRAFRVRNFGLGGFSLCLVARGACAGYIDLSGTTKRYDVEAGLCILNEAGGRSTNFIGTSLNSGESFSSQRGIVATNCLIHNELLSLYRTRGNRPEPV